MGIDGLNRNYKCIAATIAGCKNEEELYEVFKSNQLINSESSNRSTVAFLIHRGHNEKINSNSKGVFLDVIELCKDLDIVYYILVTRKQILLEIETAQFVSIIVNETTGISNMFQLVIVFRYELKGQPVECFWGFLNPDGHNAESLTSTILSEINPILKNTPNKLIAQSYDCAAVMSRQKSGVNVKVKELYPYAYCIHCYAHQLNWIMTQSVSQNKEVRIFFF
ncbi:zinc finger MYM-type protein 1-like [Sipha flava]|uniref:Zinc finger MYM-type protein 1-like n=1 Tax=Sipha flava TaxID=143950 RepID=A0A8B8G594_9HEMI|nr:zinc finger MYM-type protein 1-like [Sipha flava]